MKDLILVQEATHAAPETSGQPAGPRVVHRIIIPDDQELDVRPLYLSGISEFSAGASTARQSGAEDDDSPTDSEDASASVASSGGGHSTFEGSVRVQPERRVTFGTYFNAFPASYWRRWTDFATVRLVLTMRGSGTVIVYRSTSKGHVQRTDWARVTSSAPEVVTFDLPLKPFIDGGWYWFDLEAAESELVLEEARWQVDTDRTEPGRLTIGITTFNRPDYCVDQLINLARQAALLEIIDEILVVDQGDQKVVDFELYPQAAADLGSKLRVIEQGNLGGSGGFSRAMDESVSKGQSDYVLLLDDDVVCEPEGILRAVTFADLAKQPTVVGGQMFSLYDRSVLHAFGEAVDKYRWFWGPAPKTKHGHNFARYPLRSTEWLHRRVDVDYNGWWMCLIPTKVIREVGLALPMFIKWDDAEFGLRSGEAGFPTVTLPGVAVWHVPWHEKDDTIDWQAYFHRRNRIVAALLHSPYPRGGRLVTESFETQVKHLLSMQYGPAEMGLMAVEDILDGPERMHQDLLHRMSDLRELRQRYDDSRSRSDLDQFPPAKRKKPPRRGKAPTAPRGRVGRLTTMAYGAARQVLPVRDLARHNPEAKVPHLDLKWWLLSQFDSALVSSADGTSAAWYKRHPDQFRSLLSRSVVLHARLAREWPRVAQEWQRALPELVSSQAWKSTFDASTKDGGS